MVLSNTTAPVLVPDAANTTDSAPAAAAAVTAAAAAEAGAAGTIPCLKTPVHWTAAKVAGTLGLFILAGLAEIGGGWLVWQGIRNKKPWWWLVAGFAVLCCYGLVPTLQPAEAGFARVYAVYGGVFVIMSYAWGAVVDGDRPDVGDWVGASIAVAGVLTAWFWPR